MQTHCRIGFVDVLTACARRTESIHADIGRVEVHGRHIVVIPPRWRRRCECGPRLRFPARVSHDVRRPNSPGPDDARNVGEAADFAWRFGNHFDLPAGAPRSARTRETNCPRTMPIRHRRAGAYFQDDVLVVVGVFGQQRLCRSTSSASMRSLPALISSSANSRISGSFPPLSRRRRRCRPCLR